MTDHEKLIEQWRQTPCRHSCVYAAKRSREVLIKNKDGKDEKVIVYYDGHQPECERGLLWAQIEKK